MKISVKDMTYVSIFAALMVVGAYLRIPLSFLPVTLQGFFCAFAGILLGSKLGLMSQLIYILMGLAGLPVFTGGGGINYVFNPSFGYIIGFALGTYFIGLVSEKIGTASLGKTLVAMYIGLVVIYLAGLSYTYFLARVYLGKPDNAFLSMAIVPFFVKDLILYALAGVVVNRTKGLLKIARA